MNNDLISRSALIKWIDDSVSQYGGTYSTDMMNMWGLFKDYLINNVPAVEPKKGKWIVDGHHYICSNCGKTLALMFSECDNDDLIGCPYCFSDMREDKNE